MTNDHEKSLINFVANKFALIASLLCHIFILSGLFPSLSLLITTSDQVHVVRGAPGRIYTSRRDIELNLRLYVLVCLPTDPRMENWAPNYYRLSAISVKPVTDVAVRDIIRRGILPPGVLQLNYVDTAFSDAIGPWQPILAILNGTLDCILGYANNYGLSPVARSSWLYHNKTGVPVITSIGQVDSLDDRNIYRQLTRMTGSYRNMGRFLWPLFKSLKWAKMGYIFQGNIVNSKQVGKHECYHQVIAVRHYDLENKKMLTPVTWKEIDLNLANTNITQDVADLSMYTNIMVLCGSQFMVREVMLTAHKLGMTQSGRYVFINIHVAASPVPAKPWYRENVSESDNARAREAFKAMKIISIRKSQQPNYPEFAQKVRETAETEYNYSRITGRPYQLNPFLSAFYEGILLYSIAVNETLQAGSNPNNGTEIVKRMWNRTFEGITGNVSITPNGDRNIDYAMLDYEPKVDQFVEKAYWSGAVDRWVQERGWYWITDVKPKDEPICGWDMSLCPEKSMPPWAWVIIALLLATVVFTIVSFFIHRHYKLEAELAAMTWRIRWEELSGERKKSEKRPAGAQNDATFWGLDDWKRASIQTDQTYSLLDPYESRTSLTKSYASEETIGNEPSQQIFTKTALYKGTIVALKKLNIIKPKVEISRAMLLELKKMKDLQHDHITRFVGACIDPPHTCIVSEYCPKGSLEDILEDDSIKLDKMMIYSLLHDLVKGMIFIHTSDIRSHGNLKSSNCVIDGRFVLKITDFGLYSLHALEDKGRKITDSYYNWKKKLWTSPELLRLEKPPYCGTQKGDVYSFAIILHETAFRQGVFYLQPEAPPPQDIINQLIQYHDPPLRPSIDDSSDLDESLVQMMTKCWAENPADRPDFTTIRKEIRFLNRKFETSNLVDNLLKRMEQYATNLEGLVEERTAAYLEEKRKAENLLYQLLPESVASELIQGKPVTAESFDSVTIYFSDIVGFTSICSSSTPMQVVTLLGDLYTCFDATTEHFDVYKIETIGDAYVVVSGLPKRNGTRHAYEIARLSLALLNKVQTFRIRHMPEDRLNLRIGLHSGPVCAGVVGLKMPRYCLFGDTVNTASRMESTGLPLKIHVSSNTKEILDTFECFQLELRGEVEMKGKGTQTTYWLNGATHPADGSPHFHQSSTNHHHHNININNSKPTVSSSRHQHQHHLMTNGRLRTGSASNVSIPGHLLHQNRAIRGSGSNLHINRNNRLSGSSALLSTDSRNSSILNRISNSNLNITNRQAFAFTPLQNLL